MEIEAGLHHVKALIGENKPLDQYILSGDCMLWVDAGINNTPQHYLFPYLESNFPDFQERSHILLVTHADVDHFGGLQDICRRLPQTITMAHGLDKRWIESADAILFERYMMHTGDGISVPAERQLQLRERGGGGGKIQLSLVGHEHIDLGKGGCWSVLHAPGHTNGHIVLWEAQKKWAIIGDAALSWGVPDLQGNWIAPPPYYHVEAYEKTIRMLLLLNAERMFTSHYGVLNELETKQFLVECLQAVSAIGTAVMKVLKRHQNGITLRDLCREVGQIAPQWKEPLWDALVDPVSAHLLQWHELGRISIKMVDGTKHYVISM